MSNQSNGIGLDGILVIVLITLKVCGLIDWSWWWVLAPIWIGWAFVALIFAAVMLVAWWSGYRGTP